MNAPSTAPQEPIEPSQRQVLVNIGNRYVVFGTRMALPGQPILGPQDVVKRFSERVGDESDFPSERLVQSIQVRGAEVRREPGDDMRTDIELVFSKGARVLVEVKVHTRDLKRKELESYWKTLQEERKLARPDKEIWNFNIERIKLTILRWSRNGLPEHSELEPLNVWEFNQDGTVFDRAQLVERIDDWLRRIADLYAQVESWSARAGLTTERTRTILMSEEPMQKFAIPDRDLAVLDLSRDGKPVMAFVPVGLWVIGSNGRIDIITPSRSALLLDRSRPMEAPDWAYVIRDERLEFRAWDEDAFRGLVPADVIA